MKARVVHLSNGMMRFTLDYPREINYARQVRVALAELLCSDKPTGCGKSDVCANDGATSDPN
jgi:hypothetical protein